MTLTVAKPVSANAKTIAQAARLLADGGLVAFPTETVYGLGADATNGEAVASIFAAKGRPRFNPLIVHVEDLKQAEKHAEFSPAARALARAFWPGALTLVVRHTSHLAWDLGETLGTVAVRMPDSEIARELISRTGPLATSSANRSGHPPATTMLDARLQLGASVSVYLDGGPSADSLPSSIVDVTGDLPRVLRAGAIDLDRLREVAPDLLE
jgi:tRNA threonylcarbamoyl adenosine modification protein (Sua5/YciO/YrdC/YwlC family)